MESDGLRKAKLFRKLTRLAWHAWERDRTAVNRRRLQVANEQADTAYKALGPADSEAYRKWAFATSQDDSVVVPGRTRLRLIRGGLDEK